MANDLVVTRVANVYKVETDHWSIPKKVYRPLNALIYLMDGSITYHFDHGDETAAPGSVLIFPQGLHYNGTKNTQAHTYCVIDFETAAPDELAALSLPLILHQIGDWEQHLFLESEKIWREGALNASLLLKERIYALLSSVMSYRQSSYDTEFLQEIVSYIHRHYTEQEFNVSTLADRFHISPSQLRRIFTKELGTAPLQYILNLRINLAKNLLSYEHLSVRETAERCGFQSESYFSRRFKICTGFNPGSYLHEVNL